VASASGSGSSLGGAFRAAIQAVSLGRARPSYTAVSPQAQFRQLFSSAAGYEALQGAGLEVKQARTMQGWLEGTSAPNRANSSAIRRAYRAMAAGGIPEWVRNGRMEITGEVTHGSADRRDRGREGRAPLRVDLSGGNGPPMDSHDYPDDSIWDAIQRALDEEDDDYLGELVGEELLPADDDLGGYSWGFPGGSYVVTILG
jgi:hypothetical protein